MRTSGGADEEDEEDRTGAEERGWRMIVGRVCPGVAGRVEWKAIRVVGTRMKSRATSYSSIKILSHRA